MKTDFRLLFAIFSLCLSVFDAPLSPFSHVRRQTGILPMLWVMRT